MSSFFELKHLCLAALLLACSIAAGRDQTILTLQAATEMAIQDNPDLAQIRARAQAMAAIPPQEGALPDPEISFNAMSLPVNTFNLHQEDMTQLGAGISQAIPFPGKLALREQAAAFEAEAASQNITEARWRLLSEVKTTWWLIFYLDRTLQITDSNYALLQQFVEIARTKYEVGEGLQQDVLLAQLELSKLLNQQLMLKASRRNAAASLNALLDKSANSEVHLPETVVLQLPTLLQENRLYQQAETSRAILESNRLGVNAAQSRLDLAKKGYLPDFNLGASYGARANTPSGDKRADLLSLNLSINVPIFAAQKQAKAVDQRTSELLQEKYTLQDEWNKVRSQITQGYTDYQRAKDQVVLFETGILPQARQTVASMLAGYQVNKVDFLNLVRSQITLFEYETQYWKAFTEANQSLAQISAAVGSESISDSHPAVCGQGNCYE
jgi:outer membrane protein TolC